MNGVTFRAPVKPARRRCASPLRWRCSEPHRPQAAHSRSVGRGVHRPVNEPRKTLDSGCRVMSLRCRSCPREPNVASKTGKSGATTSHTRRGERRSAEMIRRHPKFHSSQINSHPRSKHRLLLKSLVSGNGQEDCRAATALCSMTLRCAPACAELTHAARRCRHRPYGCARHGARRQAAIRGKVLLWVGCIAIHERIRSRGEACSGSR